MNKLLVASLWIAALAIPALGAVNKDGGKPAINPCVERPSACAEANPADAATDAVTEPTVIYLDANGEELVRLPLSRFRKERPDVKLPPSLERE